MVLVLATALLASTAGIQLAPGVLGPLVESSLRISQAQLGLLSAALTGGMALGLLPGGILADRFGERLIMTLGVAGAGLVVFVASFAGSFAAVDVLFLLASIGAAFAATGGAATITRWFAPNRRGTALGVRQAGVPLGGLAASILLPAIALATDWRVAVRCAAVAAILVAFLFWALYRDPEGMAPAAASPAVAGSVYRSRRFIASTACAFTLQTAQACTLTYLTVDLHQTMALPAAVAALFLGVVQVGALVGRIAWGSVGDWIGNRRALTAVAALASACCVLMSTVGPRTNLVAVGALCFLLGMAAMSWNAVYISLVAAMAPHRAVGSVIGSGLSIVLPGFFAAPLFGRLADIAHSFRIAWIALSAVVAVGVAVSLIAKTPRPLARSR